MTVVLMPACCKSDKSHACLAQLRLPDACAGLIHTQAFSCHVFKVCTAEEEAGTMNGTLAHGTQTAAQRLRALRVGMAPGAAPVCLTHGCCGM